MKVVFSSCIVVVVVVVVVVSLSFENDDNSNDDDDDDKVSSLSIVHHGISLETIAKLSLRRDSSAGFTGWFIILSTSDRVLIPPSLILRKIRLESLLRRMGGFIAQSCLCAAMGEISTSISDATTDISLREV